MIKTLQEQITDRIAELDLKEEYDLSNAWESLKYLRNEYDDYLFYAGDKAVTFKVWYEAQKQNWLYGSGSVTDIDYWVSDVEQLWTTDITTEDFTLFDNYFNSVLDNK